MKRRLVLAVVFSTAMGVSSVGAQTLQDHMVAQLQAQGFVDIEVTKTWLGRTRIEAVSGTHEREIIINSRTGEILRDYWKPLDDDDDTPQQLSNPSAASDDEAASGTSGGGTSGGGTGGSGAGTGGGQGSGQAMMFDYLHGGHGQDIDFA